MSESLFGVMEFPESTLFEVGTSRFRPFLLSALEGLQRYVMSAFWLISSVSPIFGTPTSFSVVSVFVKMLLRESWNLVI